MSEKNGGPAFPTVTSREEYTGDHFRTVHDAENGMSLRDYFAGQAMHAELANPELLHAVATQDIKDYGVYELVARHAYRASDAMLAERSKP